MEPVLVEVKEHESAREKLAKKEAPPGFRGQNLLRIEE